MEKKCNEYLFKKCDKINFKRQRYLVKVTRLENGKQKIKNNQWIKSDVQSMCSKCKTKMAFEFSQPETIYSIYYLKWYHARIEFNRVFRMKSTFHAQWDRWQCPYVGCEKKKTTCNRKILQSSLSAMKLSLSFSFVSSFSVFFIYKAANKFGSRTLDTTNGKREKCQR